MAEVASPKSTIDAIAVGEYERTFTGARFATLYAWCTQHASSCGCLKQEAWSISATATTEHFCRCRRPSPRDRSSAPGTGFWQQRTATQHGRYRGIPCPSSADPNRKRRRTRGSRTLRTVAVILANPRYTGRQIRNRRTAGTSEPTSTPALSVKPAHAALVTEQDFVAAQTDPGDASAHQRPPVGSRSPA
ncbi:recombinase family protein [Amycolatopsis mongoliensis]|uniref:Recombinase family protein n=1 Tax=Amycolatopsis mongoliensis TaxID=715475 RepID=A0A9Y2JGK0_9PSEU|nr:recombinase family protein [Amycolatopsis sp. 4-36]WIX98062.1 recombinase family protein [Amycolatopsis sp. 4-36]